MMNHNAVLLPSNNNNANRSTHQSTYNHNHAVSRSKELLACARTALRQIQNEQNKNSASDGGHSTTTHVNLKLQIKPNQLQLWKATNVNQQHEYGPQNILLEDASIAVQATERSVTNLERLVRRRGHTNDPTGDIDACMADFKSCMGEIMASAQSIRNVANKKNHRQLQCRKHYQVIATSVEGRGKELTERFQKALAVRSHVLKMQAQRKKMLVTTSTSSATAAANNNPSSSKNSVNKNKSTVSSAYNNMQQSAQFNSPLFTMTGLHAPSNRGIQNSNVGNGKSTSTSPYADADADADAAVNGTSSANMGMRRRVGHSTSTSTSSNGSSAYSYSKQSSSSYYRNHYSSNYNTGNGSSSSNPYQDTSASSMQAQVQERKAARDTKARLDNARQVESAIAELGQMFGKMANLVASQQEVVDKIEDDIEAAAVQVNAGADEIQKVYTMVQGNRGLIIKVFALLIFFILFF
eukprot:CAMPEP_0196806964 /NCGR_PEP_ID=MMETSP1362-20130617/6902_1 /TAXON_ID=163516 /ORGANISM="Leptocylindrus danicus, Strain CCMP1856" /LENGTH=466 /DNA_ID=CAMNT_0042180671 /DNA_START=1 /DNA_END=1398 /DNA_ORIENTATION=+